MKHKFDQTAKDAIVQLSKIAEGRSVNRCDESSQVQELELCSLNDRVDIILNIYNNNSRPASHMLAFIMYDISDNKVRTLVAKYLERRGCVRIQNSIFIADLPSVSVDSIRNDLVEVQAAYENNDSILVVPITDSLLSSMKIIGRKINIDLITQPRNTLFF